MEKLSNEERKQLFYKLKEFYDSNPGEYHFILSQKEDEIARNNAGDRWEIINNNGPLGIRYAGKDEQGKNVVQLIGIGHTGEHDSPEYIMSGACLKSYSDEELSEFLNSFFDMSNMDIINEFLEGNGDIKTLEEMYPEYKSRLMYLYALDSLKNSNMNFESSYNISTKILSDKKPSLYPDSKLSYTINTSNRGLNLADKVLIDFEGNYIFNGLKKIGSMEELSEEAKQNSYLAEIVKILDIMSKSMREFPDIWEKIKSGTYKEANTRTVDVSEIKKVAEGVTLGTAQNALGVVTNSNEELVINNDGQSHNDE